MRTCFVSFEGRTPYSPSKAVDPDLVPKLDKEKPDEYDKRTWRHKATVDTAGNVCIPAMAFKMAVDEAVKRLALQVPGRGKTTYTKFFVAGQICDGDVPIGAHIDDVPPIVIWANADGVRGSGKRVKRAFPYIEKWKGTANFQILDDAIPNAIFEKAIVEAGRLIGIGRFRPEKGGFLGRFSVTAMTWKDM
jgi:hypothetical protein